MIPAFARFAKAAASNKIKIKAVSKVINKTYNKNIFKTPSHEGGGGGGSTLSHVLGAGWQIQSWQSVFSNYIPSVTNSVGVTVVGHKGTPFKNVMHVALATAFGIIHKVRNEITEVGLTISLDHMHNAVQVSYIKRQNLIQQSLLDNAGIGGGIAGFKDIINGNGSGKNDGRINSEKENSTIFIEKGLRIVCPIIAAGELAFDAVGQIDKNKTPDAPKGNQKDPQKNKDVIEQIKKDVLNNISLNVLPMLWSDPQNNDEAYKTGFLAKEEILAREPTFLLRPINGSYPEPMRTMLFGKGKGPEVMITRFPVVGKNGGDPALNPRPAIPWDKESPWSYKDHPREIKGVTPVEGYDFDLRSLVAQALSDPYTDITLPQTDQSLSPQNVWK